MSSASLVRDRETRTAHGNGGGPIERFPGGGDDGGHGDGSPNYDERLRRYRLGLALALASVLMLFITFSGAYLIRRGTTHMDPETGEYIHVWSPMPLPMRLLWLNTSLLVLSSLSLEMARRRAVQRARLAPIVSMPGIRDSERTFPWLAITIVLGIGFLAGQGFAWNSLANQHILTSNNVAGSFFYLLTGTHALHLLGGVAALLWAAAAAALSRPIETQHIIIDVTAWYWHVMAVLWLYVFALLAWA